MYLLTHSATGLYNDSSGGLIVFTNTGTDPHCLADGMLTPHNRGQGAYFPRLAWLHIMASFLCILSFKNEHLICGKLKVNNVSFQSYRLQRKP